MYTLNPTVVPPAINRCRVIAVEDYEGDGALRVTVQLGNAAQQRQYGVYVVRLYNTGPCRGVEINPDSTGYNDYFRGKDLDVPGAADAAVAVMIGTRAQRRAALEQYLVGAGLLPAGA